MDATGLVSLEGTVDRLRKMGIYVSLGGVQIQPMSVLQKSGIQKHRENLAVYDSMDQAISAALERSRISGSVTGEMPATPAP